MTKFEEELFNKVKVTNIELTTEAEYKKSTLINHFKNWHSDEEFQELKEQNENQAESILLMLDEIKSLKSQLQQQALPVVPEYVAEYIERCKRYDCGLIWAIRPDRDANDNSEEVYDWLFPNGVKLPNGMYPNPYEPDNLVRPDKENQIKFVRAWLDGYTVEKPQLFYLKNKLTGKYLRSYTGLSMDDTTLRYEEVKDERVGGFGGGTTFTQLEIDSMETGSYELVPVEEGK